jgi:hypothetical protein
VEQTYRTFDDQVTLLTEKGYLESNFKTPAQLGEWLREFRQAVDNAISQAELNGGSCDFMIPLHGKFNEGLDTVTFNFQYRYDLQTEALTLLALRTHMNKGDVKYAHAKHRKTFRLKNPADLVLPAEVYARLSAPDELTENLPLWARLYRDFQRDKNPENDPKPDRKLDPYDDPKDKYEYDPQAEDDRDYDPKVDDSSKSKFVRKPTDNFTSDSGVRIGLPPQVATLINARKPVPMPPKPSIPKNIRR